MRVPSVNRIVGGIVGLLCILTIVGLVWGALAYPDDPMGGCQGAVLPFVILCVVLIGWAIAALISQSRGRRGRDA